MQSNPRASSKLNFHWITEAFEQVDVCDLIVLFVSYILSLLPLAYRVT